MRRLALAAAALAALAAPTAASAGGLGVQALNAPPAPLTAGGTWTARLRVVSCLGVEASGFALAVRASHADGRTVLVSARETARPGIYEARLEFPTAGTWTYTVRAAGATYDLERRTVEVAPAARPSRLLATLPPVGAVLLVLGTGIALRRRRS
jgi:hypothetical protein